MAELTRFGTEVVRVKDGRTGHHYTTAKSVADADPDRYTILDQPAVDAHGDPLPQQSQILTSKPTKTLSKEETA